MNRREFIQKLGIGTAIVLAPGCVNKYNDHQAWLAAVKRTNQLRQVNSQKFSSLEKDFFYGMENYRPDGNKGFPEYRKANINFLRDVFQTSGFFTTQAVFDLTNRFDTSGAQIPKDRIKEFIESEVRRISEAGMFKDFSAKYADDVDCRMMSSAAAALYLNITPNNSPIDLVTGIFFGGTELPTNGHQWTNAQEQIIDPAIAVPTTSENYVPLVGVQIKRNGKKMILSPRLYCLTSDMENKFRN